MLALALAAGEDGTLPLPRIMEHINMRSLVALICLFLVSVARPHRIKQLIGVLARGADLLDGDAEGHGGHSV